MVHPHQGQQRLGDGRCADADAGVVAALGDDLGALALHVDGFARRDDGTGGLDAYAHFQVLARADAADDATGVVAAKASGTQRVAVRGAALDHAFETGTDLHSLYLTHTPHAISTT